jgi:hypothetical protein
MVILSLFFNFVILPLFFEWSSHLSLLCNTVWYGWIKWQKKEKKKRHLCKKTTIPFSPSHFSPGLGWSLPKRRKTRLVLGFGDFRWRRNSCHTLPPARLLFHSVGSPQRPSYRLRAPRGRRRAPPGPLPPARILGGAARGLTCYSSPCPQGHGCSSSSSIRLIPPVSHHGKAQVLSLTSIMPVLTLR